MLPVATSTLTSPLSIDGGCGKVDVMTVSTFCTSMEGNRATGAHTSDSKAQLNAPLPLLEEHRIVVARQMCDPEVREGLLDLILGPFHRIILTPDKDDGAAPPARLDHPPELLPPEIWAQGPVIERKFGPVLLLMIVLNSKVSSHIEKADSIRLFHAYLHRHINVAGQEEASAVRDEQRRVGLVIHAQQRLDVALFIRLKIVRSRAVLFLPPVPTSSLRHYAPACRG